MLIYVCSPEEETKKPVQTRIICNLIAKHGDVPIAPRLYFPQFIHSDFGPLRNELLSICDEVWAVGTTTDSVKEEMEQAIKEHIPIKHFINMDVMSSTMKAEKPPRTFEELMGELVKVNDEEDSEEIFEFACAKARELEPLTHMERGIVEKLLLLYNTMLHDMEKVEMTDEEKEILIREGIDQISEKLGLDSRLASAVLLMSKDKIIDSTVVKVVKEYCEEHVPAITKATGLPQHLVDKIVFVSNLWRFRDIEEIKAGNSVAWWPKHIAELAERLDESESLIKRVLAAELSCQ